MGLRLSVIVPSVGREHYLISCLRTLSSQTLPPRDYEILVIDDGGGLSSEVVDRAADWGARVIRQAHTGVCRARNLGISMARAPLVVFLDDDCMAAQNLLEEYLRFFDTYRTIAGAGGTVLSASQDGLLVRYAAYRGLLGRPVVVDGRVDAVITANACFRRPSLEKAGGFEPLLDRYFAFCGGEDADLSFRLLRLGYELAYCPNAVVYHHHRSSLSAFIEQQVRNGEGLYVHAYLRRRRMSSMGMPEPGMGQLLLHLLTYVIKSRPESPSLLKRCCHYLSDASLTLWDRLLFPFVDLLRRCCYLWGIRRAKRRIACHALCSVKCPMDKREE